MPLPSVLKSFPLALSLTVVVMSAGGSQDSASVITWELERRLEGSGLQPDQTIVVSVLRRIEESGRAEASPTVLRRVRAELLEASTGRVVYWVEDEHLIPEFSAAMMEDPLVSIDIDQGRILISTEITMSMGSWTASSDRYNFRFQGGCFRLIGHDHITVDRSTAAVVSVSANLLTNRFSRRTGNREIWGDIESRSPVCLGSTGGWHLPELLKDHGRVPGPLRFA